MPDKFGLCHVCGKVAARTCRMCGRPTCAEHLRDGICSSCRGGKG